LFEFFERNANPSGGAVPVDVNVLEVIFGQKLGVIKQARRVNAVASVIK
jgi:hypothetical protein